jgi:hypothetical protein
MLLLGAGCSGESGDRAAERQLDEVARSIGREALQHWSGDTDPVWLALWAANDSHPMQDAGSDHRFAVRVEPLGWRRDGSDGVLDLRIRVDAAGHSAVTFGDHSYGAGTATRCLRLVIGEDPDEISCRGRTVPALPDPPTVPALDDQVRAGIRTALRRPTLQAATARAQALFPQFTVGSEVVDGSWVLVVTRSPAFACMAGVRDERGRIRIVVPERRVMQPGEGGCDPYAILHPPKTH